MKYVVHVLYSCLIAGKLFGRSWDIVEYGVCHLDDMLSELPANTVNVCLFLSFSCSPHSPRAHNQALE